MFRTRRPSLRGTKRPIAVSAVLAISGASLGLDIETAHADCSPLGAGTYIVSGSATRDPSLVSSSTKVCLRGRSRITVGHGTIGASDYLDLYAPTIFLNAGPGISVNSVAFFNTTVAAAPTAGTDFLRMSPMPTSSNLGATRINLVDVTIGANRAITLTSSGGDVQNQDLYFASLKNGSYIYDRLTISNPNLLVVGKYNLTGQDFDAAVSLTLKDSTVSNATITSVQSGSRLTLDNTTINSRFLFVDGELGGNGTVNGASGAADASLVTDAGSTLSPGNSIGTLTINGNLSFRGATGLTAELDPTAGQNADRVDVSGNVTGASNLTVTLEKDSGYSGGTGAAEIAAFTGSTYVVLDAASIDSDNIALVEGGSLNAHLSASLVGQPSTSTQVEVQFTDNSATPTHLPSKVQTLHPTKTVSSSTPWVSLTSAMSATHNSTQVNGAAGGSGGGGQTTSNGSTVSQAFLSLTNANLLQLNEVHAEPYSSNLTVGLEQADHVTSTVMNRISGSRNALDEGQVVRDRQGREIWLDVSGVLGEVEGEDGLGTFTYQLANVIAGADILASEAGSIGAFAGYGYHSMSEHDNVDQSFTAQSGYAGLYGNIFSGRWALSASAGYAYTANSASRINPDVGLFTGGKAEADFSSHTAFLAVKGGYEIDASDEVSFKPFIAASYAHVWQGEAKETGGGDFNYDVHSATADAFMTGLGIEMTANIMTTGTAKMQFLGGLRYDHDWSANQKSAHDITVTSDLFGTFNQTGQNRGAHSLTGSMGLTGAVSDKLTWRAGVSASLHEHGEEVGAGAHFKWTF